METPMFDAQKSPLTSAEPLKTALFFQENITEVPQITIEHVPVEKVVKKPVETGLLSCNRNGIFMGFTWDLHPYK